MTAFTMLLFVLELRLHLSVLACYSPWGWIVRLWKRMVSGRSDWWYISQKQSFIQHHPDLVVLRFRCQLLPPNFSLTTAQSKTNHYKFLLAVTYFVDKTLTFFYPKIRLCCMTMTEIRFRFLWSDQKTTTCIAFSWPRLDIEAVRWCLTLMVSITLESPALLASLDVLVELARQTIFQQFECNLQQASLQVPHYSNLQRNPKSLERSWQDQAWMIQIADLKREQVIMMPPCHLQRPKPLQELGQTHGDQLPPELA